MIRPGDVYWVQLQGDADTGARIPHPHVVIAQDEPIPGMVILCALTTNTRKISLPGNVLLNAGEANLPRQSAVEVSKQVRLEAAQLGDYIGALSQQRMEQIIAGIAFVQRSFFTR